MAVGRHAPRAALAWAHQHRGEQVRRLVELLSYETVSADPASGPAFGRCAAWLASRLRACGCRVVLGGSRARPLVVGRLVGRGGLWAGCRPPHVVLYAHYDVVPVRPLGQWRQHPFRPIVAGGSVWARGAADNKGPLLAQLHAVAALVATGGARPDLTILLDGEEEIGSPSLAAALRRLDIPPVDAIVVADTRMAADGRPALTTSLRGSVNLVVSVHGAPTDLHSGAFGGAVENPAHALAEAIASLHDDAGRIAVAGLAGLAGPAGPSGGPPSGCCGAEWTAAEVAFARAGGGAVGRGRGEPGWTPLQRATLRPALNVIGLGAGHLGAGARNAIPAVAVAHLNARLVGDQTPGAVTAALARHLSRRGSPGVRTVVERPRPGSPPVTVDRASAPYRLAGAALAQAWGRPVAHLPSGGSIPAVALLQRELRAPLALMGFARHDDGLHAPNERFGLDRLWLATDAHIRFLALAARQPPPR